MNDLAQALAEREAGWEYRLAQTRIAEWCRVQEMWEAVARRSDRQVWSSFHMHKTPAGAVRMLNEALREAGK